MIKKFLLWICELFSLPVLQKGGENVGFYEIPVLKKKKLKIIPPDIGDTNESTAWYMSGGRGGTSVGGSAAAESSSGASSSSGVSTSISPCSHCAGVR